MHPTCSNCSLSWRRQLSKIIKTYSHQTISQILCFPKHFRLFPLSLQMALMNNTGYGIVLEWKMYHSNEFLLYVYEETRRKYQIKRNIDLLTILYDIDYTMWWKVEYVQRILIPFIFDFWWHKFPWTYKCCTWNYNMDVPSTHG